MLKNITTGEMLVHKLEHADTPAKAVQGLLGRSRIEDNYAMIIYHCQSIHTWYMKFSIDVIFLDPYKRVLCIVKNMAPWRYIGYIKGSEYAIESKVNSFSSRIAIGDQLAW
ncbi:hypothetical protein HNQ80_003701 [Anaerosolibacter carboniphilus]|uniref:DUF192 domain-containing protein n=1 Tax=Anaerosolibacter carboniphilus TaxID=1417629 RepID=A0A841KZ33_9FIRM|nr:DUF192 domain-containing protein [Anaerosolibacter carboniphilus]MBB6217578.1 hypothetical protein [Anaerosolibacter carboniphilus]